MVYLKSLSELAEVFTDDSKTFSKTISNLDTYLNPSLL